MVTTREEGGESMSTEGERLQVWRDSLPVVMLLSAASCLGCCTAEFRSSRGTYELPCIFSKLTASLNNKLKRKNYDSVYTITIK
jgi:hypothetical protein